MSSPAHQALIRLLTEGRGVLRAVIAWVGIDVPGELELHPGPEAIREGSSNDRLPDGMVLARCRVDGVDREGFVLEVQLGVDRRKRYRWPLYVVVTRSRFRCPVTLLVVTDSEPVARWAARPIVIGRGMVLRPVVIGPRQIPRGVSIEVARRIPALAVLVVVAHGRGPDAERFGRRAIAAVRPMLTTDEPQAMLHMDVIFAYLDEVVLARILEDEMSLSTYEPISEVFKRKLAEGRTEGRAEGRTEGSTLAMAQMIVRLLERRGLSPSSDERERIDACRDPATLERWFDRAVTAAEVHEIFEA